MPLIRLLVTTFFASLCITSAFLAPPAYADHDDNTAGICDRTEAVHRGIVSTIDGVTDCALVTAEQLAAITFLSLSGAGITTLKVGDFAGLSALTQLFLSNNQISTLPAGAFSGLSALTRLDLGNNQISTLPAGAFSGLSALTRLDLGDNQISTLPVGAFSGLSALTGLNLSINQISTLPDGIFSDLSALTALFLGINQISTLPVGIFSDLSTLTALGLGINQISTLPVGIFSDLSTLTALGLGNNQISTLPAGIFSGLSALTALDLDNNQISTLPAGAFSGLSALTVLDLDNNQISTLPAGAFSGLSALTEMDLGNNQISTLPAGAFSGLSALTRLFLVGNPLDTSAIMLLAGLPATVTAITNASGGICTRTKEVRNAIVNRIAGVTDCASVTTTHLAAITFLFLRGAGITTLKMGDFVDLSALTGLNLSINQISTLPDGIFSDLSALTALFLGNNQISTLPDGIFSDLSALTFLLLDNNQISTLPAGIFSGLSALTALDLDNNQISTLPAGIFSGLSALIILDLDNNQISTLPAGIFSGLSALTRLGLVGNPLDTSAITTLLAGLPATVTISVSPVAEAGQPQTVARGTVVTLDGSASFCYRCSRLTYTWTHSNVGITLTGDNTVSPTFTAPANLVMDAMLTFSLTVTDARELVSAAADTVTITVTVGADRVNALAKISAYAQDGSPVPTVMDYTDAGVTGVTMDNLDIVNAAVLASSAALTTTSAVQTLVDPAINMAAALAKISAYAQDGSPVPTVMDYTDAGVTGVTMDNLDIVNAAVLASSAALTTTSAVQTLVDPAINMAAALAKISAYAEDGSPVPTVMDYTDAGVTGVTIDNLDIVNAAVLASTAALASTSAVQTLVDPAINMAAALAKISAYAQTDGSPVPTVMDYTDAGVTGVTIDNLDIVNAAVAAVSATEADTTDKIQALVTKAVEIVERIKQLNTAIMPRLTQAMLGTTLTSISSRLDGAFSGAAQSSRGQLDGISLGAQPIVLASFLQKLPSYVDSLKEGNTNWRRMLANSSFTLSPQDAQSGSAKGLTVWGIGDYSSLGDKDNSLDWDGEVFTVQLGIDKRLGHNLLVGGLVSWSDGDVDADLAGAERSSYNHQMISVHPYLAWSGKHAQLWGSLGYGQGKLKIGLGNDNPSLDTRLVSMVAGGEGRLSNRLSLKSDIALAQTDIDGSSFSTQQNTNSQRLRLLLKADLISRGHYTAALEAGARYDNGDGDSGLGAVLNASMAYNNPASGLTVGAKLHTLLGRDNYSEWGLSGLLELATKANGRGLAFSLSPSYSLATQDSQAIWQENQLDSANNLYAADQQMQLDARLSYGLLAFATQGLLTPYSEVTFGDTNSYRLGIHWQGNNRFDLHLFGEHRESHSRQDDQAIMLKGKFHF